MIPSNLKLIPSLGDGHPHIRGENAVKNANNAALRQVMKLLFIFLRDYWYLRPLQDSICDHVGIFIDTSVLRVDTEQKAAHTKEKEENYRCLHALPGK